jgi:hypothetical protein
LNVFFNPENVDYVVEEGDAQDVGTCNEFTSLLIQSEGADDLLGGAEYFRANFSGGNP